MTIRPSVAAKYSFLPHRKGTTHYHRVGSEDSPIIVMVSGATLPMAVWQPLVVPLINAGFQIIRYDLPGRGHTPLTGLGGSFQAHLNQLNDLLSGLGITQPVHLVGLASGALVVAAFAQRNPSRVAGVCLIAPDGASTHFSVAEKLLRTPVLGTLVFRLTARQTLLARIPRYSSRQDIQNFVRELLEFSLCSPDLHKAVLATVRTFPLRHGDKQYQELLKTGIPTCIVWGSEDYITPANSADVMKKMFGEKAMHLMMNIGHLPFVEDPIAVATIIESHFKDDQKISNL